MDMDDPLTAGTDGNGLLNWLEDCTADRRGRLAILTLALLCVFVLGLGSIGLWGAREKRLAACVVDVVRDGHWLIPNLWGRPRLEKPPLPYWISAMGAVLTGRLNEWTLRLPALLAAILIVAAVYHIGCQAGGSRIGLLAGLFLLSSVYFVSELRQPSSDLFLCCFATVALACWWRGYQGDPHARWGWWTLAGLGAGLAMACKGPVALAVIAPPIIGFLGSERELSLPRSGAALAAIVLALAVGLAWPLAVLTVEPDAWVTWLRQLDLKVSHHSSAPTPRGFGFYAMQWPQYLFPWAVFAVAAAWYGFTWRAKSGPLAVRFTWFWFFGNLLLFSLFRNRKIYYLLPAVPALAVLAAYTASRLTEPQRGVWAERLRRVALHAQFVVLSASGIVLAAAAWFGLHQHRWLALLGGLVIAVIAAAAHVAHGRRGVVTGPYAATALGWCLAIGGAYALVLPQFEPDRSHRSFAQRVAACVPRQATIYFWGDPDPSLWFYLDRPLRPLTADTLNHEHGPAAYCLTAARDLGDQPDVTRRLDMLETERTADGESVAVLGRLDLPLRDVRIFDPDDPLIRKHTRRASQALEDGPKLTRGPSDAGTARSDLRR